MEKIINNLKYAAKNVFFHLNEFIAFFIATFMIQVAFGVVGFSFVNNNAIDYKYALEDAEYHIELRNLNSDQYYYIRNDRSYSDRSEDKLHELVDIKKRNESSLDDTRYDVFIKFMGDNPVRDHKTFNSRYNKQLTKLSDGQYSVHYSDIMAYHKNAGNNFWVLVGVLLILSAICVFLMMTLFSYRLNHFKFTYGIYLTFGANYKKLVSSSFWEMLLITCITAAPACIVSVFVSMLIYRAGDFVFAIWVLPMIIVMSIIVTTVSVLTPMKVLASSTPINALKAEDNSNYVSSVSVSSKRFFSKFPKNYIKGTFSRYKRYIIRLVLCGVVFGVAYIGGLSFSHLYSEYLDYNRPVYSLAFNGVNNYYSDDMREDILNIDGVIDVLKVEECTAKEANSHILLNKGDKNLFSDAFSAEANGGDYSVTNSIIYRPIDSAMAEYLDEKYEIEGDISTCLSNDDYVLVSNSRYNQEVLKLSPGDEIYIATYISNDKSIETIESGKEYLRQQLEHNRYSYRKYTVGAVISGMPTGAETPVYMSPVDYSIVTRNLPGYTRADIYLEPDISAKDMDSTLEALREYGYDVGNVSVGEMNDSDINKLRDKNYHDFVVILSIIVLIIMPVLLMFAQILFYLKRDSEMYVLEAFGATTKEIRRIYMGDGIIMAILSGALYTVLSFIVVYALNRIGNILFTYPGFDFEVPWLAFAFGLLITVGVSFLSSVIPYYSYQRKKNELLRSVAGEV